MGDTRRTTHSRLRGGVCALALSCVLSGGLSDAWGQTDGASDPPPPPPLPRRLPAPPSAATGVSGSRTGSVAAPAQPVGAAKSGVPINAAAAVRPAAAPNAAAASPAASSLAAAPATAPAAAAPTPTSFEVAAAPAEPNVEAQIQDLRQKNQQLIDRLNKLSDQYDSLSQLMKPAPGEQTPGMAAENRRSGSRRFRPGAEQAPGPRRPELYEVFPFIWMRDDSKEIAGRGPYKPDMPALEHKISDNVFMGGPENGLTWHSTDKYFSLTFHNLTQLDLREPFQQGDPLHGGFIIPRQRWYFEGTVGDYATFVTSVNRGYASFDVLDSYVNYIVHPEWLEFRVGRMKTPSQYEYISVDEANLIGPERSLYVANWAGNRQLGAMAHGRLFERHIEYYAGAFNGQRRSFEDFNSSRDYFFYLDYRPFQTSCNEWLKGLHLVGTYNFGEERQPLSPVALRTMNQLSNSAAAAFVSPTILEFSPNAFENGPRQFWNFETVYYHKSIGFLAGVQGGYQNYSLGNTSPFTKTRQLAQNEFLGVNSPTTYQIPINGWSVGAWWFVTGEQITRRRYLVEPVEPFGYYEGYVHPGAIELFSRFANMQLGDSVFTSGLADPTQWTNRASTLDIGVNWYLNHFVKFVIDYQHTFLGSPVILDPSTNTYTKHYDMLLFRTQLFF